MPKVKFVRDAEITIDGELVKYEAGKVYDLREDRAERWKKREVAVDHVEEHSEPKPARKAAAPAMNLGPGGVGSNLKGPHV